MRKLFSNMPLVSNTAQATRRNVVGQMSDLIVEFRENAELDNVSEWRKWYLKRYPEAIDQATDKIYEKLEDYIQAIHEIDRDMIRAWVIDLIIYKSYKGVKFHQIAIQKTAEFCGMSFRLATPEEESIGIDGFVGNTAVQVKKRNGEPYHVLMDIIPPSHVLIAYKENKDGSVSISFDETRFTD